MSSRPNTPYRPCLCSHDVSKTDTERQAPDTRHQAPYIPDTCFVRVIVRRRHLDLTISWCEDSGCFPPDVSETAAWNPMVRPSLKWSTTTDRSDFTVPSPIPSTHLDIWACGSTWRRHTGKHGSSAPHQRITQPTSCPQVASPTWSSAEQVARPATKRFRPSDWRPLEACCRPWTWWCNDATALAGYANMMMMMTMIIRKIEVVTVNINLRDFATLTQNVANDSLLTHSSCLDTQFMPHYPTRQNYLVASGGVNWVEIYKC